MTTTTTETAEARNTYRAIRASSGLAAADFDRFALRLAHEAADGEDLLPRHWVRAAYMVASGER